MEFGTCVEMCGDSRTGGWALCPLVAQHVGLPATSEAIVHGLCISLSHPGWDKYLLFHSIYRKSPFSPWREIWVTKHASVPGCHLGDMRIRREGEPVVES